MNAELIKKTIRFSLIFLIFIPALRIVGMDDRVAQEFILMLASIVMFSFLLKNIWISLFVAWTVLLFSLFKFECGMNYVTNIFIGTVLFYLIKVSFKKENINLFINGLLWFVVLNIFYSALQALNFDFYLIREQEFANTMSPVNNTNLYGLMGSYWALGTLYALTIPLLLSKGSLTAKIGSFALFIPLYLCNTSLCLVMAIIGALFVLWFNMPKKLLSGLSLVMILFGVFYIAKVDDHSNLDSRITVWKRSLRDASLHPVTGLGLDSFRNETKSKPYKYMIRMADRGDTKWIEVWDNPHNLYISLFIEFSLVGLFLFGGYLRELAIKFNKSIKSNQVIGFAAFILVFLGVSLAHFPIHLARFTPIIIPSFALYEVACG